VVVAGPTSLFAVRLAAEVGVEVGVEERRWPNLRAASPSSSTLGPRSSPSRARVSAKTRMLKGPSKAGLRSVYCPLAKISSEADCSPSAALQSMGSIESSRPDSADPDRLLVTFTSRAAAEQVSFGTASLILFKQLTGKSSLYQAMAKGHNIADLTLPVSLAWYNAPPSMGSLSGSAAASAKASPGPELQQATTGGSRRDEEMLASSQDHHHRRAGEDEDEEDEGGRRR
jgi:hypothetical protein